MTAVQQNATWGKSRSRLAAERPPPWCDLWSDQNLYLKTRANPRPRYQRQEGKLFSGSTASWFMIEISAKQNRRINNHIRRRGGAWNYAHAAAYSAHKADVRTCNVWWIRSVCGAVQREAVRRIQTRSISFKNSIAPLKLILAPQQRPGVLTCCKYTNLIYAELWCHSQGNQADYSHVFSSHLQNNQAALVLLF